MMMIKIFQIQLTQPMKEPLSLSADLNGAKPCENRDVGSTADFTDFADSAGLGG